VPAVTIRDAVRTAVLATNPHWPFSVVNKYPYYLAIKFFTRLCSSHAPVKAVYLRSGLVERAWVPAVSDIDFTVAIDADLFPTDEFSFLQSFWRQISSLKKVFPMIGEVEVLPDKQIRSWTQLGFPGHMAHHWHLLYGNALPKSGSVATERFARDCLNYTLHWMEWFSRSYFANKFFLKEEASGLLAQDLRRLGSKIFRSLERLPANGGQCGFNEAPARDESELCARIIVTMERETRRVANMDAALESDDWQTQFISERHPAIAALELLQQEILHPWRHLIESVMLDFNNQVYLVFRDGLEVEAIARCVAALQPSFRAAGRLVTAASREVFTYMIRQYQPNEYVHLSRQRKLAFGKDLLAEIAPPSKAAFARFLLGQVPNVLAYPQSRDFHSEPKPSLALSLLERAFSSLLYLEHDLIAPIPETFRAEAERRYPAQMHALRAFHNGGVLPGHAELFEMFKALTERIHGQLESRIGDGGLIATA